MLLFLLKNYNKNGFRNYRYLCYAVPEKNAFLDYRLDVLYYTPEFLRGAVK